MSVENCFYCKKPITEGRVAAIQVEGEKKYLHRQGPIGSEVEVPQRSGSCYFSFTMEANRGYTSMVMEFSDFEKEFA